MTTLFIFIVIILCIIVHDVMQPKHTILHNYPVVGHLRFIFEKIGPELRQYFIENNREGLPFNRSQRSYIYSSSKKENINEGFGSDKDFNAPEHFFIKSSLFPAKFNPKTTVSSFSPSIVIGEQRNRRKPYSPKSLIGISGMSFGALSGAAVEAMNSGAKIAGCYQNTGEGGLSKYHTSGADIIFQIGTGYNGVRNSDGSFSMDKLLELVHTNPFIKMIEIKLSQGAKPGAYGTLPASKMTEEIRITRGLQEGEDSISPGYHTAFGNAEEMIIFIEKIAKLTGLPVGIKCGVGKTEYWEEIATIIAKYGTGPDYIVIDGAEGGTGSAKASFTDHVGLPFMEAFTAVYKIFLKHGVEKNVVWIGSGKLGFPAKAIEAFAIGCDLINIGRESLMSIGCIQAQKCHTNNCPSGIATQNKWKQAGLDPTLKSVRFANYLNQLQKDILEISASAGYNSPIDFNTNDIMVNSQEGRPLVSLKEVYGYTKNKRANKNI